jgi:DNA replication protein DnaC
MRDSDCGKCGLPLSRGIGERGLLEPWCNGCRREHRTEYAPIREAWVRENAAAVLRDMGVPPKYRVCTLANFETITKDQYHALRAVERWIKGRELGLFLCGLQGTGKTHLAVAALLEMCAYGYRGRFVSVQELLLECRDSFRKDGSGLGDLLEELCGRGLLLLDDLGTENSTAFSRETMGQIVDRAYRNERPLIVTSNYPLEELTQRLDDRTVDRLIEICFAVKLAGSSYRVQRAVKRASARNVPVPEVLQ